MGDPRQIVILEGPDGGGKSTLAQELTEHLGAHYVHLGSFPRVKRGLARLYVEAMMPALLGYRNVVMDRSWLSEPIYGQVFRAGQDRVGVASRRMLERLAMRCLTHVVLCRTQLERHLTTFRARRGEEMLEREDQLCAVHALYGADALTDLPVTLYNYAEPNHHDLDRLDRLLYTRHTAAHPVYARSGGNLLAETVLVGEALAEVKDADPLFRVPFMSFDRSGCSAWLTEQLERAGVSERDLLWVNADDPSLREVIQERPRRKVIALGRKAHDAVITAGLTLTHFFDHPQAAKRFAFKHPYPLLEVL